MEIDIAFDHCEQIQSITNTMIHSTEEPTIYGHSIKWTIKFGDMSHLELLITSRGYLLFTAKTYVKRSTV